MTTVIAEHAVAEVFRACKTVGAEQIELLLSAVLAEHAGYHPRALDGFLVEKQVCLGTSLEIRGFAILVEHQSVEPAIFALVLNAQGEVQSGSTLRFGLALGELVPYGSSLHGRLSKCLLSEPPQVERWAHKFVRTADAWKSVCGIA